MNFIKRVVFVFFVFSSNLSGGTVAQHWSHFSDNRPRSEHKLNELLGDQCWWRIIYRLSFFI